MNRTVKLITAITGLLVAIGTLVGTITVTLGKGDDGKNKLVDLKFSRCNIERALDLLFGRGVVLCMMILEYLTLFKMENYHQ